MTGVGRPDRHVPTVAWVYGALGLLAFAAGAVAAWLGGPQASELAQLGLLVYGGLILAFLGGGRWGLEIGRAPVRPAVISGSMAGAVVSTLLVAATPFAPAWRLVALALAHVAQWAWDVRSNATPPWYPRLRHVLTAGAVLSLLVGAAVSLRG